MIVGEDPVGTGAQRKVGDVAVSSKEIGTGDLADSESPEEVAAEVPTGTAEGI